MNVMASELATTDQNYQGEPSAQTPDELYKTLREWFHAAKQHSDEWRTQAKSDYDFYASRQWSTDDENALKDQGRQPIVFNRIMSIIRSVCGMEINGRLQTTFLPRNNQEEEIIANEMLSGASQWMDDNCDAPDEQSEAFRDSAICGIGCTEQYLDYCKDAQGMYVEDKINPLEMYWDCDARKKNLVDAKYIFRARSMKLKDAQRWLKNKGINVDDADVNADWAVSPHPDNDDKKTLEEKLNRLDGSVEFDPKAKVTILHAQWIEYEPYFKVAAAGQLVDVTPDQHGAVQKEAKKRGIQIKSVPMQREVFKEAFVGAKILGEVKPTASRAGFTFRFITGEHDQNKGTFFGLVSIMRDPQMWANKWLVQTLHILNSTAKGGVIIEDDAVEDIRQFTQSYAQPNAVTEVKAGTIAAGKIMPKPGQGLASGHLQLMEFAISSIRDVSGISEELLGMREADQPGVLEAQRKQAGMTILAPIFDSYRRFRKLVGRNRLCFIQDYLSDGRLIRIKKPDGKQVSMKLIRDKTAGEYEVVVDDAPSSPNQKIATWATLQQLMPVLMPILSESPEATTATLDYLPLPESLITVYKTAIADKVQQAQAAQQPQTPEQQLAMATGAANLQAIQAKTNKDNASAEKIHTDATLATINTIKALHSPQLNGGGLK